MLHVSDLTGSSRNARRKPVDEVLHGSRCLAVPDPCCGPRVHAAGSEGERHEAQADRAGQDGARQRGDEAGSPAHAGMHPARASSAALPRWLPRPRGDAPSCSAAAWSVRTAPPPTRGCTLYVLQFALNVNGSPAHAGMHPSLVSSRQPYAGLPRPRGDAPVCTIFKMCCDMAPPPTRGCTRRAAEGKIIEIYRSESSPTTIRLTPTVSENAKQVACYAACW